MGLCALVLQKLELLFRLQFVRAVGSVDGAM